MADFVAVLKKTIDAQADKSPELRQRVTAAAAELGYVPNKAAQAMARGFAPGIGLMAEPKSSSRSRRPSLGRFRG